MTHNSHDHDGEDDLDLIDPTPDVHDLFVYYNARYFHQALAPCQVSWSKRMTLCAGLCSYDRRTKYCSIRLSEPLLKYRPRTDLINTLLVSLSLGAIRANMLPLRLSDMAFVASMK